MNKRYGSIFIGPVLCLLAAALLSGCSLITPPDPLQIVVLNGYKPAAPLCQTPLPIQIMVPAPYASAGLNTDRIAVLVDDRKVHYLADYRWDAGNVTLVQRALVDAMNDSGCFRGAGTGSMALRAEYRLETDVKFMHFIHPDGQNQPSAQVSLLLRLIDVNSGLMIGQYNAYARERAANGDIFKSMENALQSAVQNSLYWLRESLGADQSEK